MPDYYVSFQLHGVARVWIEAAGVEEAVIKADSLGWEVFDVLDLEITGRKVELNGERVEIDYDRLDALELDGVG